MANGTYRREARRLAAEMASAPTIDEVLAHLLRPGGPSGAGTADE